MKRLLFVWFAAAVVVAPIIGRFIAAGASDE